MQPDKQRITNLEQSVKQLTEQQEMTSDIVNRLYEQHEELVIAIERNDSVTAQEVHEMKQMLSDIRGLLQAWIDAKGFVKWIGYIATFIKWMGAIGSAIAILWLALKSGVDLDTAKEISKGK